MSFLAGLAGNLLAKLAGLFASWVEKRRRKAAFDQSVDWKNKRDAKAVDDAQNEDELEKAARDLLGRS